MEGNEGGGDNPPNSLKRPRGGTADVDTGGGNSGGGERINNDFLPYFKPNYKRQYPENSTTTQFKVFVEHNNPKDKLGNKSPIYLNHIFTTTDIKGVVAIQRLNANKIAVVFKQCNNANNFLNNSAFLEKHDMKAYIPAAQIEKIGIIRFVPANISNKDLYTKLSSIYEIIAVRRFTKKIGQERVALQTVSITFLSNNLPDNVQYDLFSYRVFDYIPPLQQCFKCFKFNHSAKICNGRQRCSICSGDHLYKDCDKPTELCCANCSGPHLAISKLCPIKINKILEKKTKITYASATQTKKSTNEYPSLPLPKHLQTQNVNTKYVNTPVNNNVNNIVKPVKIVHNKPASQAAGSSGQESHAAMDIKAQILGDNGVLMALVQTLVELGNRKEPAPAITTTAIRDMLIKNLSNNGS